MKIILRQNPKPQTHPFQLHRISHNVKPFEIKKIPPISFSQSGNHIFTKYISNFTTTLIKWPFLHFATNLVENRASKLKKMSTNKEYVNVNCMMENSKELDRLKKEQEEVLGEISNIHKKLHTSPDIIEKAGDGLLVKLRSLYVLAKELAEKELIVSDTLAAQIDTLLQSTSPVGQSKKIEGTETKKKRIKANSDISKHSLAASMRSQLELAADLKGEHVAGRVTPDYAEKDEWFVVKVIHFDRDAKEFEVFDEPGDDEDGGGQR